MSPPPFQTFLERHRDAVYRFLVFSVGPDAADDCLQETFTAALRAYPRLTDGSLPELPDQPAPAVPLPDPGLWEAVSKLPPKQRAAIVLRFVSDLPFRQIGSILESSEAAARQNVREGLAHLREEYTDDER